MLYVIIWLMFNLKIIFASARWLNSTPDRRLHLQKSCSRASSLFSALSLSLSLSSCCCPPSFFCRCQRFHFPHHPSFFCSRPGRSFLMLRASLLSSSFPHFRPSLRVCGTWRRCYRRYGCVCVCVRPPLDSTTNDRFATQKIVWICVASVVHCP